MLGISKTVPAGAELESELSRGVKGQVRLDQVTRGLYATDASVYQMEPLAVVVPRDAADVAHVLKTARERGLKVLPRGGGTSLAGQTVANAIVIDFSQYMNQVVEVNEAARWVRVQPGRVREELNTILLPTGLHFGPETATANRANIGGMIGNNSSGTRSIVYGKTVDHILELDTLLLTGERLHMRSLNRDEWDQIARRDDREGVIYRTVRDQIETCREQIEQVFPKVMRRVGGYNLDYFPKDGPWNLSHLVCGSEGTLATTLEAKLDLDPLPKAKAMTVIHFRRLMEALRAVAPIVKHGPSMVELLDRSIVDPARKHHSTQHLCDWIEGDPNCILIIEFFGDTMEEAEARADDLIKEMKSTGYGYAWPKMLTAAAQGKVFAVRQKGQGLMMGAKGDAKSIDFIDDSAVPVEVLPDYIDEVLKVCTELGAPVNIYAHASVGLLHVRPILNLKIDSEIEKMRLIAERTFDIVKKYGGSWSGEHGDGLARSFLNEKYFGPEIYNAFREIKKAFDPLGLMNPGKIIDSPPMTENLRFGVQYRKLPFPTHYHYREEGGFGQAVEMCTGVGECRKTLAGTMCPSYRATRDEKDSTRGRANALRLAMTGQLGLDGMTSDGVRDALELCLGCKACKSECPSNVDMAKLKEEFMAGWHEKKGTGLGERFFANGPAMAARLAGPLAPLFNAVNRLHPVRVLMERFLKLDRRRPLPGLASETFPKWFERRPRPSVKAVPHGRRVILFDDTFMNYHEPQVGRSAVGLLEALGYHVELARAGCCQRPLISHGFLKEAKAAGEPMMRKINAFLVQELPVLIVEPSCYSALTDDLPDLIDNAGLARRVAEGVRMIDVFLAAELEKGNITREQIRAAAAKAGSPPSIKIHGHCHQKALSTTEAMKTLLGAIDGAKIEEIPSGCCGMAGSFGYWTDKYEVSKAVGEDRLLPAVRRMEPGEKLIACGFSCRHQIHDLAGAESRHFVEVMAEALGAGPD